MGMLFLLFFGTTRGVCAPSFGFFSEQDEQALMDAFFASRTVREVPKEAAFGAYLAGSLAKSDMDFKSAARYSR